MKKINYILILITVCCLASCDLDRLPETTLTDSAFWKTETDLRGACNRMYNLLGGFNHDTRADDLIRTTSNSISDGSRTVPNTSGDWTDPYYRIFVANNILMKAPGADVKESVKNRYLAEAYFFRAYYYFMLVQKYGDVPLILKAITETDDPLLDSPRTPREEVIQQCYKDLDFAAQWLPTRANLPAADWGRVTRSAALAMKERIGLYEGTFSKYHGLSSDYRAHLKVAIDAAELVLKEGHTLYPDFQKLFTFDGEGAQNKENIFVKIYGPNDAGTVVHGNSRQLENSVSLTRNVLDSCLYADGLPYYKTNLKPAIEKSYDDAINNRDPRVGLSLYRVGEEAYKGPFVTFSNQHGYGYGIKKGFMLDQWTTNSKETVDKMLIRYAEVLLSYAEALYEYNGSITDVQLDQTVNAVRARVGFNVKLTNAFVTSNNLNMLNEIRRERIVEFIDEGFRYDDIIRWKIAEKVLPTNMTGGKFVDTETSKQRADLVSRLTGADGKLNGLFVHSEPDLYVIELAADRVFDPAKDYLYPIPLNEISLSGNAVVQNPGWSN